MCSDLTKFLQILELKEASHEALNQVDADLYDELPELADALWETDS